MKKRKEMNPQKSSKVILLKTIWFISFLCVMTFASAQNLSVKGVVKDAQGQTLPGVTVMVKGTQKGTLTDENGKFAMSVPAKATLTFKYVGMQTKEVVVNSEIVNVTLLDETKGLSEVVVVGYGTQKKVAVTASVASVESKELMKSSAPNLSVALAGKLSGLSSLQSGGGQPGSDDATIKLRGISTLNGSDPLILIDGVPRSYGSMNSININEIESVSVLKDASATAVFGVRGANGVLMITTKRGVEGKANLNVNFVQSFTSFTKEPAWVHSVDYMKYRNLALTNDGLNPLYTDDIIAKYEDPYAGLDPNASDYAEQKKLRDYIYCDHDYYREFIKKYTPQTNLSIDVTGGTKNLSYFINGGYVHQGGNLNVAKGLPYDPSCKMDRFTFRTNLDYKATSNLSAFLNLGTYIQFNNQPISGGMYGWDNNWCIRDLMYQATSVLSMTPGPVTIGGFGVPAGEIVDPGYLDRSAYEIMNGRGSQQDAYSNLNSTLGLRWDLGKVVTPGLSLNGQVSFDTYSGTTNYTTISKSLYLANVDYTNNSISFARRTIGSTLSVGSLGNASSYRINAQASLNYDRTFGKHKVGAMILAQRDYWDVTGGSSDGLIPYNVIGLAGRATYSYDDRYLAEYDMGYNGSEQFAPTHRFGYFPAYSLGWVASNEGFLQGNNTLTSLKFRATYGKVGNDQMGGSRFLYLDNNTMGGGTFSTLGNGRQVNIGLIGNPDLHWEIATKQNYGVDFTLFKNLKGTFESFFEHRTDILIQRSTVPQFQGVPSGNIPKANMGIVNNHGWEAELSYHIPVNKDLSFDVKGNLSYNKNKIIYADEVIRDSTYMMRYSRTGQAVGQRVGYKIDWATNGGYWTSSEEYQASGLQYEIGTPGAGDFRYKDLNGDGKINTKDQVPIGYSTQPQYTYGLSLAANYKNFDASVFFSGVANYSVRMTDQNVYEYTCRGTYYDYMKNSWTLERFENGEKITYPALHTYQGTNHVANDFFITNKNFTRLKNVEVGYSLNHGELKSIGISQCRVYVGGQNLYLWAPKYRMTHLDVELNDPIGYPITKMYNIGCRVTF